MFLWKASVLCFSDTPFSILLLLSKMKIIIIIKGRLWAESEQSCFESEGAPNTFFSCLNPKFGFLGIYTLYCKKIY